MWCERLPRRIHLASLHFVFTLFGVSCRKILSASHMKRHLQCAEQQESQSNFTKYCACHAKWISWLIRIRYETSFTMRGATRVTLQLQQILRLPSKVTLMIVAPHIWNVVYIARSNTGFHPTSPNTAPAMKFWVQDVSGKSLNCFRQ